MRGRGGGGGGRGLQRAVAAQQVLVARVQHGGVPWGRAELGVALVEGAVALVQKVDLGVVQRGVVFLVLGAVVRTQEARPGEYILYSRHVAKSFVIHNLN